MEPRGPDYMAFVERLFEKAAFIADVGFRLVDASPGQYDSELRVCPSRGSACAEPERLERWSS